MKEYRKSSLFQNHKARSHVCGFYKCHRHVEKTHSQLACGEGQAARCSCDLGFLSAFASTYTSRYIGDDVDWLVRPRSNIVMSALDKPVADSDEQEEQDDAGSVVHLQTGTPS